MTGGREVAEPSSASRPASTIARAMGCSDPASTAAASRSSSGSVRELSSTVTSLTDMTPSVTVPVLSSTIVSTVRVSSRTSGPRIRMPSCEARPVPASSPTGVARPSAHGQAMTSTATAARIAELRSPPEKTIHSANVSTAMPRTIGTNTAEMRSARRAMGALPVCASETSRPICARVVSSPVRVARTSRRPEVLTVAPVTVSSGPTSSGTDSPVISEVSTAECPSRTTPSVATFSPGRTRNSSPGTS